MKALFLLPALLAAATLISCNDAPSDLPLDEPRASFVQLQEKVLSKSCATAGCHVNGSERAIESGLVLEADVAYANLVNVDPKNANALADGLKRVTPGSPDMSLLWHKVSAHMHAHSMRDYGAPMPLGRRSLTDGQVEFIKQWILAGAPATGDVADSTLLDDTVRSQEVPFTPLAPPAPGSGYQVTTGPFTIAPYFERELFIYRTLGNSDTIYVNRLETKMRLGSHHFLLYGFMPGTPPTAIPPLDVVRDLRNPDGTLNGSTLGPMSFHIFLGGGMTPYQDYTLPDGVALLVPPNAAVDLNSHYVNGTPEPTVGEAFANFHTVDRSAVTHIAKALFLSHDQFYLPAGERTTITKTFTFNTRRTIILLTSHTHKRAERFLIRIYGGPRHNEVIYESTDWSMPPIAVLDTPLVLQAGEGLTSEVTYYNESSAPIEFGLTSEDEMDIMLGYWY